MVAVLEMGLVVGVEPPYSEAELADLALEETIAELIRRKYAAKEGSAEHRMAMRQLVGRRLSRENAGPIIEQLDPDGWAATHSWPPSTGSS
jgi:hypothetical protein